MNNGKHTFDMGEFQALTIGAPHAALARRVAAILPARRRAHRSDALVGTKPFVPSSKRKFKLNASDG